MNKKARCPRCNREIKIHIRHKTVICPGCGVEFETKQIMKYYQNPPIACVYASPGNFGTPENQLRKGDSYQDYLGEIQDES